MKNSYWLLLPLIFIFMGCSTSKEINSQWQSEDFKSQKFDRLIVYANTEDTNLQKEIEDKIAIALSKESIRSLGMHVLFPEFKYEENHSQEEIDEFLLKLKKKNINKVLLVSRKSVSIDTVVAKSFRNYLNSLEPLSFRSNSKDELIYDEKELTIYTLEAVVYDFEASSERKPIATTTLKSTNPKSIELLKNSFIKAIVKLFKNR